MNKIRVLLFNLIDTIATIWMIIECFFVKIFHKFKRDKVLLIYRIFFFLCFWFAGISFYKLLLSTNDLILYYKYKNFYQNESEVKSNFMVSYTLREDATFEDYVTMIKFLEETYPDCKIEIKNSKDIYLNVYSDGDK